MRTIKDICRIYCHMLGDRSDYDSHNYGPVTYESLQILYDEMKKYRNDPAADAEEAVEIQAQLAERKK